MEKENLPLIIPIDKPEDMTSFDLVAIARRKLGIKNIGHLGTLDPMATGLVLLGINGAARVMEYLDMEMKEYSCRGRLGLISDTQDIWGEVRETGVKREISPFELEDALKSLEGVRNQEPPIFSALKMDGKKLYEYAREGKEVDLSKKTRKVYIENINLTGSDGCEFGFTARVSKGTYIRTICSDLGNLLGTGAVMTGLRRSRIGNISLELAISHKELVEKPESWIYENSLRVESLLSDFGSARTIGDWEEKLFVSGVWLRPDQFEILDDGKNMEAFPLSLPEDYPSYIRVYNRQGTLLGMGIKGDQGTLKAKKVFNR